MKKESLIFDVTLLLAVTPAALYTVGTAYRNGYLSALKLNEHILSQDFHQTIYQGFVRVFGLGIWSLLLASAIAIILTHILIPMAIDELFPMAIDKLSKSGRLNNFVKKYVSQGDQQSLIETKARVYARKVFIATGATFLTLLLLAYFEGSGKNAAEEHISQILSNTYDNSLNITVQSNNETLNLIHIACGARNCAGYDPKDGNIVYYPLGIMRFPHAPPTPD